MSGAEDGAAPGEGVCNHFGVTPSSEAAPAASAAEAAVDRSIGEPVT
jgi:hypothetical protein